MNKFKELTHDCINIRLGDWCGTRDEWHREAKIAFNIWNYENIRFKCRNCGFVGTIKEWQSNHATGELFEFSPTAIILDNQGENIFGNFKKRILIKLTIVGSKAKYTPFWNPSLSAINS